MTIEELMGSVSQLKSETSEVETRIVGSSERLLQQATTIGGLTRGSHTGEQATIQVQNTARSLKNCALSLRKLDREFDNFLKEVSK